MFNNLIESSSHSRELRRRGSFFLFTTASYSLLFAIIGLVSIHAYDAKMENQDLDVSILRFAPVLSEPTVQPDPGPTSGSHNPTAPRPTRPVLIDTTNNPLNIPPDVGVVASPIPPAPKNAVVGDRVSDPPGSGQSSDRGSGSDNEGSGFVRDLPPPPPASTATPAPLPKVIKSPTILNSKALSLPKPPYPPLAKLIKVQGTVSVQVFIDESGKVVSAKAVSGPATLVRAAEQAALQALFSPTRIGDQPVKVSGTITYNFVLQP
ncbi:MAG TPA: TonB family protein [Pyrinomonadaceae bacterium]|nr:TonB family protein [Pyrinomonadaceae bacterium]